MTTTENSAPAVHEPWWRRWVFSTDHKTVGIQYGVTAAFFLLLGFALMLIMRWQLAYPGEPLPMLAGLLGPDRAPEGVIAPEFYNQLGAMHGTIMVFLAIVPLVVGAFGNYLVPLQIGAADMAFPRMNMLSYWVYLVGGIVMLTGFVAPGGAASSGWTSYPPLASIATVGQTIWLLGMFLLIVSSLLGSINLIVTILQLRAPGLDLLRLPYFCWAQLVTSFLLLLAFPALQAAAVLQLMDRLVGTSFFLPSGLVVNGEALQVAGGGSPLLWQHLFWFLAHPEVYVLILPAFGIVAEIVTCNVRRPLWGYRWVVGATLTVGVLAFVVWAHHMFLTGMGTVMSSFFQATTMMISIPSVIVLTCLLLTLWGGRIRYPVPMLFALAFLPMFGLGGLTGLPLGLAAADIQLHDTYYVIGHFHYVVAPGTIFAIFAGIYHWFPKMTGRQMNSALGHLHFWPSLVCMNGVFFPMFLVGMAGVSRRLWDGGAEYEFAAPVLQHNETMSIFAWLLALAQVPFLVNLVWSVFAGRRVAENPWRASTLEWASPSPPLPHRNFEVPPMVEGPAYAYDGTWGAPGEVADGAAPVASGGA